MTRWFLRKAKKSSIDELEMMSTKFGQVFAEAAPAMFAPILESTLSSLNLKLASLEPNADVQAMVDDMIARNTEAVASIPTKHIERLREHLNRPGNVQDLQAVIAAVDGITERRAKNIALDQTRKNYQSIALIKSRSAGVRRGRWIHSHGSKHPRHKHVEAHGKEFDLDTGLPIGDQGQYVLPSEEYGCKCTFEIILDFEADDE